MAYIKEHKAWVNLFKVIFKENGYYTELTKFTQQKNMDINNVAGQLAYAYLEDAPGDISPYYFLDSIEDAIAGQEDEEMWSLNDIYELVDYIWDHQLWKE